MLSLVLFILDIFKIYQSLFKKLLIAAWCIGWNVTIVFWICVYPALPPEKIPPLWLNILSHGGVHLIISYLFYKNQVYIRNRDFIYPSFIMVVYMIIILIPFKYSGVTIYPQFLDELIPSILMMFLSISTLVASFFIGKRLSQKSKSD